MKENTLTLISEPWQVSRLAASPEGTIIALDAEVEEALAARGTPYISGKDYRTPDLSFRDAANAWARAVLEDPRRPFIEYRGVSLGKVYFYPLYLYFTRLAYWIDIVSSILERYPKAEKIIVHQSAYRATETTGDLAQEEIEALVESVKFLGAQKGVSVMVVAAPLGVAHAPAAAFALKRRLFGCLLALWNTCMNLRSPRPLRILVSDYWRNIGPLAPHLEGAELVFIDRLQALEAGLANLWRWRMRFYHLDSFAGAGAARVEAGGGLQFNAGYRGFEVGPLLGAARRALVRKYVPRALREIDGAYEMLERLQPAVIVLRVSTAPQTHYSVLAQVGRILHIPSVEFQHGLEYNGKDSFTVRKTAEYIGVYGSCIEQELVAAGIAPERIAVIGSPRFDAYGRVHKRRGRLARACQEFSLVCIYPDLSYGDGWDSWDIDAFMRGLADSLRGISEVRLTVKLRGPRREDYFRRRIGEICKGISHTVVRDTSLPELFEQCDAVVSCYSTAILEAMQSGAPLVFYAAIPLEARYAQAHLRPYLQAGALLLAETPAQLSGSIMTLADAKKRLAMERGAKTFLDAAYAFDGSAAVRAAELLKKLASRA